MPRSALAVRTLLVLVGIAVPTVRAADVANPITNIDRTVKLYIGGKQSRPDSGYSIPVHGRNGELLGEAPLGNRKTFGTP